MVRKLLRIRQDMFSIVQVIMERFFLYLPVEIMYMKQEEKITVVKEDFFFDNQPWYVRLILEGEDRLCRNREVREHNNCISYSHISEGWCELVDKKAECT